jgi:hypothetical protein
MRHSLRRGCLGALCASALAIGVAAPAAQAASDDPIFIYKPLPQPLNPSPIPPPAGGFEGPCGLAVNNSGNFYLSDYYHHAVDIFSAGAGYITQIAGEDPLDGPCGLAVDAAGDVYVNNFHRNVVKFGASPGFGAGTVIDGAGNGTDPDRPTGVAVDKASGNVYVDDRTQVTIFDSSGVELGQVGSFGDGYGLAVSEYVGTEGFLYVPDAATDEVLVYDPATPLSPVGTIDGSGTPNGHFTSLTDAAVAVDKATGEVYVADDLTPEYAAHHEGVVYVFSSLGVYEGRLKFSIEDALPPGLAVDNSSGGTKSRVYLTSGNSEVAAVYVYPPHAATSAAIALPKPPPAAGTPAPSSSGSAAVTGVTTAVAGSRASGSDTLAGEAASPPSPQALGARLGKAARHHHVKHHRRGKGGNR